MDDLTLRHMKIVIKQYLDEISNDLKVTSNRTRLKILYYLLDGTISFQNMEKRLQTKKTQIANHLAVLNKNYFIKRQDKGLYAITPKGMSFLQMITKNYRNVSGAIRKIRQRKSGSEQLINFCSLNPVYQPGWNSYISSVAGILISMGIKHDYYYVGGRTGYCFLISVKKDVSSFLGGSILSRKAWKEIYKGTESLGWRIKEWRRKRRFPDDWLLQDEDYKKAEEMFNAIKRVIDYKDTPVVLWGVRIPTFAIVRGYDNDAYLVSTVNRREGRDEYPIRFDSLKSLKDFKFFYFFEKKEILYDELEDRSSIKRAVCFSKGNDFNSDECIAGFEAFEVWSKILKEGEGNKLNVFGNSFLGRKYYDARDISNEYISRLDRKYSSFPFAAELRTAANYYRLVKRIFEEFMIIFPYYNLKEAKFDEKSRNKGSQLLMEALEYEKSAVYHLEKALELWQI